MGRSFFASPLSFQPLSRARVAAGSLLVALLLLGAVSGCGSRRPSGPPGSGDAGTPPVGCAVGGPTVVCSGDTELTCNTDGTIASMRSCAGEALVCAPDFGCVTCRPGRGACEGNTATLCRADGSGSDVVEDCGARGLVCDTDVGICADLCAAAETSDSYIGCESWPTTVVNPVAAEFDFAVVVANPQVVPAMVTVTRGGVPVSSTTVAPGATETIRLPWVPALKDPLVLRPGTDGEQMFRSTIARGGAYRLVSTVPVTVYQFNPLEYEIPRDCVDEVGGDPEDGRCNSYSNDASLLLPAHVLTGNYIVPSYPSRLMRITAEDEFTREPLLDPATGAPFEVYQHTPGFVAVTAVEDGSVEILARSYMSASADGSIAQLAPGEMRTFTLSSGDVLQLVSAEAPERCASGSPQDEQLVDCGGFNCFLIRDYCTVSDDYDLSGTEVRATGRVSVISGHACAFVPYNRWACDHIEEAIFPLEAWGKDFIISATQPIRSEPNLIRIVSGADNNAIQFEPGSIHAPTTLNRGQVLEFESNSDFRVTGSEALLVGQFLVGQDYAGVGTAGMEGNGDPALSLGIPIEQFRDSYVFLAPTTYEQSWVNITAPSGQEVLLDGAPVTGFLPVGGSGFSTARVMIPGGQHTIRSTGGVGIVVYGFGAYTSYMYPGGLDFENINPLI